MTDKSLEIAAIVIASVALFLVLVIIAWKVWFKDRKSDKYKFMSDENLFKKKLK